MKLHQRHKRGGICLLLCTALLSLASCEGVTDFIGDVLNDYLEGLTDTVSDTGELTLAVTTEPAETEPQQTYEYITDPGEVFPDEASQKAAQIADGAIAEGYRALNHFPDDPDILVYDYDPAHHPTAYSMISERKQAIYDTVYGAVSTFGQYSFDERYEEDNFISYFLGTEDALSYDHPDIYMYYFFGSEGWKLFPTYIMPGGKLSEKETDTDKVRAAADVYYRTFDRIIDKLPEGISNYQKCIYLCSVISGLCTYDYTYESRLERFPTYGTLIKGSAVCQGYAEAFMLLARAAGIECDRTWGSVHESEHVWNRVQTSKGELYIDPTWTDNRVEQTSSDVLFSRKYFMMTREDLDFFSYENVTNTPDFLPVFSK